MPLLIDCYNVLHADPRHTLTTASLCGQLARSHWVRHGITLYCDGRPKPHERFTPPQGVLMVHSGPQRSADDLIIDAIEDADNPRRLIVVSSDRAIIAAARSRHANAWSSEDFLRRLHAPAPHAPQPDKASDPNLTEEQIQAWLRAFGLDDDTPQNPHAS